MTVASTLNRVPYVGDGVTTAFPVSFPFHSATDLVVIETIIATGIQTTKTITTHYTVSGTTDSLGHYSSGGTVNAVTAPPSTVTWIIYRDPTQLQLLNLSENNALPAESLEAQLDYVTMLVQRTNDRVNRSLRQPEGDSADIDLIPSKVDRALKYLAFDAAGDPVPTAGTTSSYVVTPFMETVLDDATAAAARATLGAITDTVEDTRTNTVAVVATFTATTTGTPAAGIGTGQKFKAESADEAPSDVGQIEFALSDVSAGSEDSYFQVLIRRAGAALAAAWRWTATGTFNAIVTHANTATRTYTFPDYDITAMPSAAATQAEQEAGSSATVYVTPGRQQYHASAAKAWVNFNGTGTVAIRASYNVASITDNGAGDYTINFTTPLASASYCPVTGGSFRTTTVVNSDYREHIAGTAQQSVNGFRIHGAATTGSGALVDFEMISVAVFL